MAEMIVVGAAQRKCEAMACRTFIAAVPSSAANCNRKRLLEACETEQMRNIHELPECVPLFATIKCRGLAQRRDFRL
jgi:hypothetical protein